MANQIDRRLEIPQTILEFAMVHPLFQAVKGPPCRIRQGVPSPLCLIPRRSTDLHNDDLVRLDIGKLDRCQWKIPCLKFGNELASIIATRRDRRPELAVAFRLRDEFIEPEVGLGIFLAKFTFTVNL